MILLAYNGASQVASSPTKVTTGTSLKTMLQIKPIVPCRVVGWGYSFDGIAAATPGTVELIEVDVAATITAFTNADITKVDKPESTITPDNYLTYTTSGSGFTASAEGSVTSLRNLDAPQLVAPTSQVVFQSPLGFEAAVQAAKFMRIRVLFGSAVNMLCWVRLAF